MTDGVWAGVELIGGLALFLFGMRLMSEHLQIAAGPALRRGLRLASRNRLFGAAGGVFLGFTIQSGPASVMLVGLTHAGLLSLVRAAPVVFGFNVGTTLAMQVLAFNVTVFWPVPLALGLLLTLLGRGARGRGAGMALIGFGLLLLGLGAMTGVLADFRDLLTPWLGRLHDGAWGGFLVGIAAGALVTSVLFSSAASIGMCLALAASGVFTDIRQVYPIILGAQLGTCVSSLLASAHANTTGRRTALLHVGFNLLNGVLGILLLPWLPALIRWLSPENVARQIVNLHTILRVATALLAIPLAEFMVRGVCYVTRKAPPPETSLLLDKDMARPEQALLNAVGECRRMLSLSFRGLRAIGGLFGVWNPHHARRIVADEAIVDRVKPAFQDYLKRISERDLSHRQALLIPALNRCIIAIERIQDHVEHLAELIHEKHRDLPGMHDNNAVERLIGLNLAAEKTLGALVESLEVDPSVQDFPRKASGVLAHEAIFTQRCADFHDDLADRLWRKGQGTPPVEGLYLDACVNELEQIVQHACNIARIEMRSDFLFKFEKVGRHAVPIVDVSRP